MASILPFKARVAAGRDKTPGSPAKIIIFPGVRYERIADEKATNPRPRRPQRKA